MNYLELLQSQFNHRVSLREKRPGIVQLVAPLYHEDGDMVDIFLDLPRNGQDKIRVSDYGMTLMRLSYSFELDTPNKERIFQKILAENQVNEENGVLYVETDPQSLYPTILHFAQIVAKVSNMRLYKREVIENLFYEQLDEFVLDQCALFNPQAKVLPLSDRDDLEVDYRFGNGTHAVFLFGVKDVYKARLATIACLEFQRAQLTSTNLIVHQDFEALPRKDRSRITSAADKQFISLDDFRQNGRRILEKEIA
ncbi:MAG: DUF1828 domain-containing protein [Deltaproteobacteria bacterium]